MVERFDVAIKYPCGRDPYAVMVSDPDGSYVMAAHYDAASAENERLTKDRNLSKKLLRSCIQGNNVLRKKAQKSIAERDEARAQVAAAYEISAHIAERVYHSEYAIRDLTPADASAALEAYGREKVREGMKRAAELISHSAYGTAYWAILAEMEKLK